MNFDYNIARLFFETNTTLQNCENLLEQFVFSKAKRRFQLENLCISWWTLINKLANLSYEHYFGERYEFMDRLFVNDTDFYFPSTSLSIIFSLLDNDEFKSSEYYFVKIFI